MGYYTTITYHSEHGLAPGYSALHNMSITVWVATEMTYGAKSFQRWHTCPKCALDYPEGKMAKIQGQWYCVEDAKDFEKRKGV